MKVLYFGDFLHPPETKLASVETKIWFKNNVWAVDVVTPKTPFEWDYTCNMNELTKGGFDGLFLDLSALKHGAHSFERQYITRMILRQIDDRPKGFFVAMNQYTYDCLKAESIKDLSKQSNLFIRDEKKDSDIPCLKKFLKV